MKTIVLNGDYGFLDKIETTVKSIIYHNQKVKIYVINPDIPHEWFINLNQYLNQIGSQIVDKKIDQAYLNNVNSSFKGIKNIAFARILIPELIKEDKVLYLDCDIVVNANLDELFNIDLENKWVCGVRDYQVPAEFNSGMLLINNKKWKESNIVSSLLEKAKDPNLRNGDQTVINEVFKGRIEELDLSYNYQIGFEKAAFWGNLQKTTQFLDKVKKPKIIHFITEDKPFNLVSTVSLRNKWWHYRRLEWSEIISKYSNIAGCLTLDVKTGELVRRNLFTLPIGVSRETMTAIVNRLEKKGFVVAEIEDLQSGLTIRSAEKPGELKD